MFVAGERGEPSIETTTLVENIVRGQTIHIVRRRPIEDVGDKTAYFLQLTVAGELATRRGQTKFTTNDILFQVRHDPGRLARLRNHMRWKQIRKKAKVKDDDATDDIDLDGVDDLVEDEDAGLDAVDDAQADSDSDCATRHPKSSSRNDPRGREVGIPPLPWSILSMFPGASDIPPLAALEENLSCGDEEPNPLPGSSTNPWLLARLIKNDKRTREMTASEYTTWSECRSASFTYRKKKTFREWCGLGVIADHRARDDVLEILGFLTSEWVQTLTEEALVTKEQETRAFKYDNARQRVGAKRKFDDMDSGPFWMGGGQDTAGDAIPKTPIQTGHVKRAFDILQIPPKKYTAMMNGAQLRERKRLRIF